MNEIKKFVGGGVQKYSSHKQNLLQEAKAPALFNSEPFAILLQLHAQVANPYTFKITKNVTAKATISTALPEEETQIGDTYQISHSSSGDTTGNLSISIPSGVTVVKVLIGGAQVAQGSIVCFNPSNDITWCMAASGNSGKRYGTAYVGVTPNKTYSLRFKISGANGAATLQFFYSSSINQETPSVTDYT